MGEGIFQPLHILLIIGIALLGTQNASGNFGQLYAASKTYGDIIQWLSDRFASASWPDPYIPTANGMTAVTQTNSC